MNTRCLWTSTATSLILFVLLGVAAGTAPHLGVASESETSVSVSSGIAAPAGERGPGRQRGVAPPADLVELVSVPALVSAGVATYQVEDPALAATLRVVDTPGRKRQSAEPSTDRSLAPLSQLEAPAAGTLVADSFVGTSFAGPDFDDNTTLNGFTRIPPDPIGAVGPSHLVETVNEIITFRNKSGTVIGPAAGPGPTSLEAFLGTTSPNLTPLAFTFDPEVTYDEYADRFVLMFLGVTDCVIDLAQDPSTCGANNKSSIFIAVSDDSNPLGTWYATAIDAKLNFDAADHWADFPALAVDEEALYVTANMFQFASEDDTLPFGGVRLWIVDKGASGGFYDGNAASIAFYDPYEGAVAVGSQAVLQPAHIHGTPPGGTVGTYLVGYSGTTSDTGGVGTNPELMQVIRIDSPLGTPDFSYDTVSLGDIENLSSNPSLPLAPQLGSSAQLETNDRRTLDAVWRGGQLWVTSTINPTGTAPLATAAANGQATAYWAEIATSGTDPNFATLTDHGVVDGEDIAAATHTFYPSIAVDDGGIMVLGFAASGSSIYPGAYFTWRAASDLSGSNRSSGTLAAGVDYYERTRPGSPLHRWGDYTGTVHDPSGGGCFWVFNQYAMTRGTATPEGDGRWATQWGQVCIDLSVFSSGLETGNTSEWTTTAPPIP